MASPPKLFDRVKETTTTTGTGTITLAGAATGFQSFDDVLSDGDLAYYTIVGAGGEWEVGIGTFTASGTTLARTTIQASSNGGAAVNFSAGTKDVFISLTAARARGALDEGTSFPSSPPTGYQFRRTDRNIDYFYDGTRWLSKQHYIIPLTPYSVLPVAMTSSSANIVIAGSPPFVPTYDIWMEDLYFTTFVATTLSGTHYWTFQFNKYPAGTTVANISMAADSPDTIYVKKATINALLGTTTTLLGIFTTKVSSPGALNMYAGNLVTRLVG